jgi:pyruvate dehydrogenase E2 component (dihydrolipoamide acetyltransferase)
MEFESFYEGTLLHIGIKEGETAAVDTLLAIVGEKDEDISSLLVVEKPNNGQLDLVDQIEQTESLDIINTEVNTNLNYKVVTMPRLSDTMEEGTVSSWLVNIGDQVKEGDILAEIETDKATMEFESFQEGTLLYIGIKEGETALVDSLLAIIGDEGANFQSEIKKYEAGELGVSVNSSDKEILTENKIEVTKPVVDEGKSKIDSDRILVSPLAKKIAKEKNIDLLLVKGSGDNGRIVKEDIENFIPLKSDIPLMSIRSNHSETEDFEEIENSQMRKVIAKRLKRKYRGMEIDKKFITITKKRLKNENT